MNSKSINSIQQAKLFVKTEKINNKVIGLCHGVFDLIHLGHIEHFKECKNNCDILIVSITSDKFVNKGIWRPHFNEIERKKTLESIRYVDLVIINNDQTSIKLIKELKPSIYFKGLDYKNFANDKTGNIIKEEKSIKSVGGKIFFTETKKLSSTYLINNFIKYSDEKIKVFNKIKKKYTIENIINEIDQFSKKNILVIGEIILDKYIYTNVLGKAGKDPILTFKKNKTNIFPGGSLAIANHLSDFCKKIDVLSYVGDKDDDGKFFKKNLKKNIKVYKFKKIILPQLQKQDSLMKKLIIA